MVLSTPRRSRSWSRVQGLGPEPCARHRSLRLGGGRGFRPGGLTGKAAAGESRSRAAERGVPRVGAAAGAPAGAGPPQAPGTRGGQRLGRAGAELPPASAARHRHGGEREAPGRRQRWQSSRPQVCFLNSAFPLSAEQRPRQEDGDSELDDPPPPTSSGRTTRRSRRRKDGKATHTKPQPRTLLPPSPCCRGRPHGVTHGTSPRPDAAGRVAADGRWPGLGGAGAAPAAGPPRRSLDRGSRCLDVPAPLGRSSAGGRRRRDRPAPLVPSSFEPRHPLNSECWGAAFVEFNQYMLVFHVIDMII